MLLAVLSVCSEEELDTDSDGETKEEHAAEQIRLRREQIKNKIRAVGRMQRVFTLLREEAESATELVIPTDPNATPVTNQLAVNGAQMSRGIKSFEDAYVFLHIFHIALRLTLRRPFEITAENPISQTNVFPNSSHAPTRPSSPRPACVLPVVATIWRVWIR